MEIHQLLVGASPGDAITNAALEIRDLLRRACPSEVFAQHVSPGVDDEVHRLASYDVIRPRASAEDLLVFHASIGDPHVAHFLAERSERVVLVYHNISPAEQFRRYDPAFAGLLESGRRQVAELADRAVAAVAVSAYNAAELRAMGYDDVRVSPLIIDVPALLDVEPDPEVMDRLGRDPRPTYLFVGQLLPHKRPDLCIQAFHVLTTYLEPQARLLLVGATRLGGYTETLLQLVRELNLPHAELLGSVSLATLVACYRNADAFITASEHEGFCVPIIEAMGFGLPVVARAHGAIPETVGGAGLVLPASSGPLLLAEAMQAVLADTGLRGRLLERSRDRLRAYDPDRARASLLDHLLSVA